MAHLPIVILKNDIILWLFILMKILNPKRSLILYNVRGKIYNPNNQHELLSQSTNIYWVRTTRARQLSEVYSLACRGSQPSEVGCTRSNGCDSADLSGAPHSDSHSSGWEDSPGRSGVIADSTLPWVWSQANSYWGLAVHQVCDRHFLFSFILPTTMKIPFYMWGNWESRRQQNHEALSMS